MRWRIVLDATIIDMNGTMKETYQNLVDGSLLQIPIIKSQIARITGTSTIIASSLIKGSCIQAAVK